jgi:hypothetical protein
MAAASFSIRLAAKNSWATHRLSRSPHCTFELFFVRNRHRSLAVSGCTIEWNVHLYPTDSNVPQTVPVGRIVGHGDLQGIAEIDMPDGEILRGDYSIVAGGCMSFGSIFRTVYRSAGSASASGTASSVSISGQSEGEAFLTGDRGRQLIASFSTTASWPMATEPVGPRRVQRAA